MVLDCHLSILEAPLSSTDVAGAGFWSVSFHLFCRFLPGVYTWNPQCRQFKFAVETCRSTG